MSRQRTPDGPAPKVYDTEKIIDIHSTEWDPSLDSKKVHEVKNYTTNSHFTSNYSDAGAKNENKPNASWGIPTLAKFAHADEHKDVDVYDYHGKLK